MRLDDWIPNIIPTYHNISISYPASTISKCSMSSMSIFPFLPFSPLGLGLFELSPRKAVAADASTCHAPEVLPKDCLQQRTTFVNCHGKMHGARLLKTTDHALAPSLKATPSTSIGL